nr:hypothetical protein [Nodosilinea sp. FACHB-131]
MIDEKYQGQGYGRATVLEVVRRLKLHPDVESSRLVVEKGMK